MGRSWSDYKKIRFQWAHDQHGEKLERFEQLRRDQEDREKQEKEEHQKKAIQKYLLDGDAETKW
jgi:hypothetical protein